MAPWICKMCAKNGVVGGPHGLHSFNILKDICIIDLMIFKEWVLTLNL